MKKQSIVLAIATLTLVSLALAPKIVEAYRGDPTIQGPNYSEERHEAMTQAFANKNYQAWKDLMQGKGRLTQVINADNFDKFAYAHQLMLEGKTDEANKIKAELGLGLGQRQGQGQGKGYGQSRQ